MRTKKIIIVVIIIGLVLVLLFNASLMPLRRDIADTEIVMVAGLDKVENGYMITLLKRNGSGSSESSSDSKEQSSSETKVIYMLADSYSVALRQLQTTTDKFLTASHIKYFIIGEETLKKDIDHITDAVARGYQTRLNSKVYVAKGMSAKAFLEQASKLEFKIAEKIGNMETNYWLSSTNVDTTIIGFGQVAYLENGEGLIDTLEFYNSSMEEEENLNAQESNSNEKINSFTFGGAAIVSKGSLVDYLNKDQTIYANYILKSNNVNAIKIFDQKYFVMFRVEKLNTGIEFKFDNKGIIQEVIISANFQADYEETNAELPIFTQDKIEYFENKLNEKIVEQLYEIINIELEKGIDFLKLKEKLEFSHPFKYEKNKAEFIENLKKAKITIKSSGKIKTTYDIIDSNEDQKGEG